MHAPLLRGFAEDFEFAVGQYDNSQDHQDLRFLLSQKYEI